ncbi:MAG TPA: hypothetical protein VKR31_11480 [Rhizomicrobium sp.]|nr:hypothetical protein [Rhizomicrobium sp.]
MNVAAVPTPPIPTQQQMLVTETRRIDEGILGSPVKRRPAQVGTTFCQSEKWLSRIECSPYRSVSPCLNDHMAEETGYAIMQVRATPFIPRIEFPKFNAFCPLQYLLD